MLQIARFGAIAICDSNRESQITSDLKGGEGGGMGPTTSAWSPPEAQRQIDDLSGVFFASLRVRLHLLSFLFSLYYVH